MKTVAKLRHCCSIVYANCIDNLGVLTSTSLTNQIYPRQSGATRLKYSYEKKIALYFNHVSTYSLLTITSY